MPLRTGGKRAVRAAVTSPSCLLLSLRLGLGVGAKADLVAFLLGNQTPHSVREMANAVGYTAGACRRSVEELSEAGWLELQTGQPAHYRAHWNRWHSLLGPNEVETPRWENWHQRFVLVAAFSLFCEHLERSLKTSTPAPSAVATELRVLLEQYRNVLGQLEIASWGAHQQVRDWIGFGGDVMQKMAGVLDPHISQ